MATADEQSKYNEQIAALAANVAALKAEKDASVPLDLSAGDALRAELDALVAADALPPLAVAPSPVRYEHLGSNPIDERFVADGNAPDGTPLYSFSGDPSTVNAGDWSVFSG